MKCTLFNKNTKVLDFELDDYNNITNIYDIYNIEYAPLIVYGAVNNKTKSIVKELNRWFVNRSIPSWRKELSHLLEKLNVASSKELLDKSYGLSLSDQYWFKECNNELLKWQDINFFNNDFEYDAYLEASFTENSKKQISLSSPNNTTDGMIQKAWIIENGKRILIKETYSAFRTEPINEWVASQICKRLGFDFCNYDVEVYKNKLVSKCECFINEDEELIPAYQIFETFKKNNNESDFGFYTRILEEHGIKNAKKIITDMFFLDYLVGNYDRHLNNYGIVRNVSILKWERVAPIYDTGSSMYSNINMISDISLNNVELKFFTSVETKINDLPKKLDFSNYDYSLLKGLSSLYKEKLLLYKDYTLLSNEVIDKLVDIFKVRIKDN